MHIIIKQEVQLVQAEKDVGGCDSGSEGCDETPCDYAAKHPLHLSITSLSLAMFSFFIIFFLIVK